MSEILSSLPSTPSTKDPTLLVFDIDNTILEPVQSLGSDQWFKDQMQSGHSLAQVVRSWQKVGRRTRVRAVEASTPQLIAAEQKKGLIVMALTSRSSGFAQDTERQLRSIGVSFSASGPPLGKTRLLQGTNTYSYINGIEYKGESMSKGPALVAFLGEIGLRPKRVVFVDDDRINDQSVNASLDTAGIENIEYRYGAADSQVKTYDPAVASTELQVFEKCEGELIPDSSARELKSAGTLTCPKVTDR